MDADELDVDDFGGELDDATCSEAEVTPEPEPEPEPAPEPSSSKRGSAVRGDKPKRRHKRRRRVGAPPDECVVHLETTQGKQLATMCEILGILIVDGNLVFEPDGLFIREVSACTLVNERLPSSGFEEYVCTERTVCGVNFAQLFGVLMSTSGDDVLCMQVTKASLNHGQPELHIYRISENGCTRCALKLLVVEEKFYEPPAKEFDTVASLPSLDMRRVVVEHKKCGDYIQILFSRGNLFFVSTGDECDLFTNVGAVELDVDSSSPAQSLHKASDKRDRYSLRYLEIILKASSISKYAVLLLAPDYPLVMRFAVGTLGEVTFAMAANVDASKIGLESPELKDLMARASADEEAADDEDEDSEDGIAAGASPTGSGDTKVVRALKAGHSTVKAGAETAAPKKRKATAAQSGAKAKKPKSKSSKEGAVGVKKRAGTKSV